MLLDVNSLLALAWPNHERHERVAAWFANQADQGWRTCAVTELGFIRLSCNPAFTPEPVTPPQAVEMLAQYRTLGRHEFLESPSPCLFNAMKDVAMQGHRQTTDAYLLDLARSQGTKLASLDQRIRFLPHAKESLFLIE